MEHHPPLRPPRLEQTVQLLRTVYWTVLNSPQPLRPLQVARLTHLNPEAVRHALNLLASTQAVHRPTLGAYQVREDTEGC
jgi:hypothetical protein